MTQEQIPVSPATIHNQSGIKTAAKSKHKRDLPVAQSESYAGLELLLKMRMTEET
jgi:hypothetical protein